MLRTAKRSVLCDTGAAIDSAHAPRSSNKVNLTINSMNGSMT
jgi:hypothetical protein